MQGSRRLTDAELAVARRHRVAGEASLACEGLYLTDAENALFDRFEHERLPHDECRRQLIELSRAERRAKAPAIA